MKASSPSHPLLLLLLLFGWGNEQSLSVSLAPGLADPAQQPLFVNDAPNALDPSYIMQPRPGLHSNYTVGMGRSDHHHTGLLKDGEPVTTTIFGYSENDNGEYLWPGKTIVQTVKSAGGPSKVQVKWLNNLDTDHILPVDPNLHWCFGLPGYQSYSMERNGIPAIPHLHGGENDSEFVRT